MRNRKQKAAHLQHTKARRITRRQAVKTGILGMLGLAGSAYHITRCTRRRAGPGATWNKTGAAAE